MESIRATTTKKTPRSNSTASTKGSDNNNNNKNNNSTVTFDVGGKWRNSKYFILFFVFLYLDYYFPGSYNFDVFFFGIMFFFSFRFLLSF
jgi:hypothetical protein